MAAIPRWWISLAAIASVEDRRPLITRPRSCTLNRARSAGFVEHFIQMQWQTLKSALTHGLRIDVAH
jgi:hypothetical protein